MGSNRKQKNDQKPSHINIKVKRLSRGIEMDSYKALMAEKLSTKDETKQQRLKRAMANCRERQRTKELNNAFKLVRCLVPSLPSDKMSKIHTLELATSYIQFLNQAANSALFFDEAVRSNCSFMSSCHQNRERNAFEAELERLGFYQATSKSQINGYRCCFDLLHELPLDWQNFLTETIRCPRSSFCAWRSSLPLDSSMQQTRPPIHISMVKSPKCDSDKSN